MPYAGKQKAGCCAKQEERAGEGIDVEVCWEEGGDVRRYGLDE